MRNARCDAHLSRPFGLCRCCHARARARARAQLCDFLGKKIGVRQREHYGATGHAKGGRVWWPFCGRAVNGGTRSRSARYNPQGPGRLRRKG
jgi:hypothetical protein